MHAVGVSVVEAKLEADIGASCGRRNSRGIHLGTEMRIAAPRRPRLMRTPPIREGLLCRHDDELRAGPHPWALISPVKRLARLLRTRERMRRRRWRHATGCRERLWLPHFMVEPRFDLGKTPNDASFRRVVEIDPFDAQSTGQADRAGAHAPRGGGPGVGADRRLACISPTTHPLNICTSSCAQTWNPRTAANRDLLDDGTLHVARFHRAGAASGCR